MKNSQEENLDNENEKNNPENNPESKPQEKGTPKSKQSKFSKMVQQIEGKEEEKKEEEVKKPPVPPRPIKPINFVINYYFDIEGNEYFFNAEVIVNENATIRKLLSESVKVFNKKNFEIEYLDAHYNLLLKDTNVDLKQYELRFREKDKRPKMDYPPVYIDAEIRDWVDAKLILVTKNNKALILNPIVVENNKTKDDSRSKGCIIM